MNVVMLGPPGAGKGTQATRFAHARGIPHISTGETLRQGIAEAWPVALAAKAKMDKGELVDDETIVGIVRERLTRPDAKRGFVLDGFPRTVAQARALDKIIEERGSGPLIVVEIAVPDGELIRRLAERRVCSKCGNNAGPGDTETACKRCGGEMVHRADDNAQVVVERLKVYERSTKPLVDYYRARPTFRAVNGAQSPDRVAHELDAMIAEAASVGGAIA